MPREVAGERPRSRSGRGILGDAERGAEHARLPARARAREAVDPVGAERLDPSQVRLERGDLVLRATRDEDVLDAVVVELDRQLRLDAEQGEKLVGPLEGRHRRHRLRHAAEDDSGAFTFESHGNGAATRLDPDLAELEWRRQHEGGAERGMARERQLGGRREDPHAHVAVGGRWIDERRLAEIELPRKPLELPFRDLPRIGEDGEPVAVERLVGEDVADDIAKRGHEASLTRAVPRCVSP